MIGNGVYGVFRGGVLRGWYTEVVVYWSGGVRVQCIDHSVLTLLTDKNALYGSSVVHPTFHLTVSGSTSPDATAAALVVVLVL